MKIRFRRALSLVCTISLLLTCMPVNVLSEEVVVASDIAPDLYDAYPFLVDEEEFAEFEDEEPAASAEETLEELSVPAEETPEELSVPAEETPEELPAPAEEAPVEPAAQQEGPAQQPVPAQKASAETVESETETLKNSDVETVVAEQETTEEPSEEQPAETSEETAAESAENTPAEADITITDEAWADDVIIVPENAEEADLSVSAELEEGKEYVVRVASDAEANLCFLLTSDAALEAAFTTEEHENLREFAIDVTENPNDSEETGTAGIRYTLTGIRFEQGSSGLIRIVAAAPAAFTLQVLTSARWLLENGGQSVEEAEEIVVEKQDEATAENQETGSVAEEAAAPEEEIPAEIPAFEIEEDTLVRYNGTDEDVTVPDGIREIGPQAFLGNETIKTVTLPDSVELINNAAFADCVNLEQVIRSEQSLLVTIGNGAFRNDAKLDITFAENVPNVLSNAFEDAGIAEEEAEETEEEPGQESEEETEQDPGLVYEGEDFTVTVRFGGEAGIPEGTELTVREILQETEEYEAYFNLTDEERAAIWNAVAEQGRLFLIAFLCNEEEIAPLAPVEIEVRFNTDEVEEEPEETEEEPKIVYAESPMVYEGEDFTVTVNFGDDAGFLQGTELRVREILPGTAEYALYSGQTEDVLNENWDTTAEFVRFFDIAFIQKEKVEAEGSEEGTDEQYIEKEIEPQAPIDVQMTFADVIPVATEAEEELQVQAIHFDEEQGAQVIESEAQSVEEVAVSDETVVDTVAFSSDSFSVYGFVQTAKITESVISADGHTYKIEVTYGQDSEIPVNAELAVEEILPGTAQYDALLQQALKAAKKAKAEEAGETEAVEETTEENETITVADDQYARFFDIEIQVDGEKKEPSANVSVSISLADAPEVAADELAVVHFAEEGTQVLETKTEEDTEGIQFETDSFSVYGVIVVPPEEKAESAELDGRTVKIRRGDYYLSSEIVNNNEDGFYRKTLNSDEADVWTIYKRTEYGTNYEFINEQGQRLRLYRISEDSARADASNGGTYFTVTPNDDGTYSMSTWLSDSNGKNGKPYYLNEDGYNRGFGGWREDDNNSKFSLDFQDTIGDGKQYILITHYEGDYYVILNDGSLVRIDDPVGNTVKIDDPMVWQYNSNNNLYHNTKETSFAGNQLASDYFYRYLNPDAVSGLTDENYDTTHGNFTGSEYIITGHPLQQQIRIQYDSTNHTISSRLNPSNYIGITQGPNGLQIVGAQDATQAAEMYFVEMTNTGALVDFRNWVNDRNHTVNHIDISIVGHAAFSVPLAYGTYYYKDNNGVVHSLVVNKKNPINVEIAQDIPIDREDVKRSNITAYTLNEDGSHKILDDVFYITGYSGNEENGRSSNQTRIEGVFKVADLPIQYDMNSFDKTTRLDHIIYYTVSTTKKVTFDLAFNNMKLYSSEDAARNEDADGVAQGTATVSLGQTMNYWDPSNECPPIHIWGRKGEWEKGAILYGDNIKDGSGLDFQLGTVDKDKYGILAMEITKYIKDEAGNSITPMYDINNVFHIYHSSSDSPDSVKDLNVDEYVSDYTGYSNSGYVKVHDKTITVSDGGIGTVYDYDVDAGMIYVEEDNSEKNLPRTIVDVNGNTWNYQRTYLETEYVWRDNGIENRLHVSNSYDSEEEAYRSVPEVLGNYKDVNGIDRYNGFLEFYVYNIYESAPVDITVQKNWKHVNGSNAEAPDGAGLTVNLGRYKLVEDETQLIYGDVVIQHNITIGTANESGKYYATYKIKQGNKVFRSASFALDSDSIPNTINFTGLPEGDYTLEVTESTNGYKAETSPTSTSVHITAGNTIENNNPASVTVNTTLTKENPAKKVKVHVRVGQGTAANSPSGSYDQELEYTFLAGKRIVFTINRPAGAYEGQENGFQAWGGSYTIPWPSVENSDAWIYTDQDWIYPDVLPDDVDEITIVLISNWGERAFYVKAVTHENESSSSSDTDSEETNSVNSVPNGTRSLSIGNVTTNALTAVSPTGRTPVSDVPGMKYVNDSEWEYQVYLGNGLWEDVVKDLDATDDQGHKYLYYIRSVDEEGFPENTNVTIHDDGSGHVLTSYGDTVLKVTNTIPDEKPKLTIKKVDDNGYPLPGATFQISGGPSGFQTMTFQINSANATYTTPELDEGEYIVTETVVPTGYQAISNFEFKVENNTITPKGTLPAGVTFDDENYAFTVENNPHEPGKLKIIKRWLDFYGNATTESASATVKLVQLVQDQQPKHIVKVTILYEHDGKWEAVNPPNNAGNTRTNIGRGTARITMHWNNHTFAIQSYSSNVEGVTLTWDGEYGGEAVLEIPDTGNGNDNVIVRIKNYNFDPFGYNNGGDIGQITWPNANTPAESYSLTGGKKTITLDSSNNWMQEFEYENGNGLLSESSTKLPTTYENRECRYMIVEEPVPDGYSVSYSDNNVQGVDEHNQGSITAYNRKTTTDVKLIKVDKENHQTRLAGAKFEIRRVDARQKGTAYLAAEEPIRTVETSNPDGEATISNLEIGYYEIKETAAPSGYIVLPGKDRFYIKITPQGIFAIEPDETKYPSKWVTRKNDSTLVNNFDGSFIFGNETALTTVDASKAWLNYNGTSMTPDAGTSVVFGLFIGETEVSGKRITLNGKADVASAADISSDSEVAATQEVNTTQFNNKAYESEPWKALWEDLPKYANKTVHDEATDTDVTTIEEILYIIKEVTPADGFENMTPDGVTARQLNRVITNKQRDMEINILKVSAGENPVPLSGAVFTLKKYSDNSYTDAKLVETQENLAVSSETATKGRLKVEHLTLGYYELIETASPAGYNMLTESPRFAIVADPTNNGELKVQFTNTNAVEYELDTNTFTVKNTPGVELPATGGNGTLWYNIMGLALILLAGGLLMVNRRRAARERG